MILICLVLLLLLVAVEGIRPSRSTLSSFELERRSRAGDVIATELLARELLLHDIASLRHIATLFLTALLAGMSIATFGWLLSLVVMLLVALGVGALARVAPWQRLSQRLYGRYEPRLLAVVRKHSRLLRLLQINKPVPPTRHQLESRDELQYLVERSGALLTSDEKQRILHGMSFETKRVGDIMTPEDEIESVDKKEIIGPLVLDDLHKKGHSRFPVTDGGIHHIIGMLHIRDFLTLNARRSLTAEKAMEARVSYIRQDQSLKQALAAFLRTRRHLFVVINESRETVGLLSLEDTVAALLGHQISDEFDTHEDIQAVAERT
jgi:CBS domain containing-hemolysin-like protein